MAKWYKKSIEVVTERNFILVLSFIFSIAFYVFQKISDNDTAKFISIFSFSLGIGEYIGDKIGEKYISKDKASLIYLFIVIVSIIFLSIGEFVKVAEFIQASFVGIIIGTLAGLKFKKMRTRNLID